MIPSKWDITTPAASYPVTFDEVYNHLRLNHLDDKAVIDSLIAAVTDIAEDEMQSSIVTRTLTATFYESDTRLDLPRGPVISITSITSDGAAFSSGNYELRRAGNNDYVYVSSGSLSAPVVVVYQAGYATVPPRIKLAILNTIGTLYDNRKTYSEKSLNEIESAAKRIFQRLSRAPMVG